MRVTVSSSRGCLQVNAADAGAVLTGGGEPAARSAAPMSEASQAAEAAGAEKSWKTDGAEDKDEQVDREACDGFR